MANPLYLNRQNQMEKHPHIHLFDPQKKWKYLIIGTFPPNQALRQKSYIDYFYGNKGFLWQIIHDIYHDRGYDFFKSSGAENIAEIQRWQQDYCVGLTDTILACARKFPLASDDSALTNIIYNHALKDYILQNLDILERLIFTSSSGKNAAFENFRIIMGAELERVKNKLVTNLPSPSGASNITFFNSGKEETLGLAKDFYEYVQSFHPHYLGEFEARWQLKKSRSALTGKSKENIEIPASPKGLVKAYKLYKYKQALPAENCVTPR